MTSLLRAVLLLVMCLLCHGIVAKAIFVTDGSAHSFHLLHQTTLSETVTLHPEVHTLISHQPDLQQETTIPHPDAPQSTDPQPVLPATEPSDPPAPPGGTRDYSSLALTSGGKHYVPLAHSIHNHVMNATQGVVFDQLLQSVYGLLNGMTLVQHPQDQADCKGNQVSFTAAIQGGVAPYSPVIPTSSISERLLHGCSRRTPSR